TRMSDESVRKATGCTWERWVKALDRDQAFQMSHREIAAHIHQKYKTPSWWTQMVTVGYERIRGLRELGQKRSGDYEISKSKTIAVPLGKLYAAFSSSRARARWLAGVQLTVRAATPNRPARDNDGCLNGCLFAVLLFFFTTLTNTSKKSCRTCRSRCRSFDLISRVEICRT